MSLTRRIQIIAAAVGGFITALIGLLLVFGVVEWTSEQTGAVSLVYAAAVAVVIAGAEAFTGSEDAEG